MFTLYWIGFCSVSKVAPVQYEQGLMFCYGAELLRSDTSVNKNPSVIQFATLPFDLKRLVTKTRFRCNFYSDESVQT